MVFDWGKLTLNGYIWDVTFDVKELLDSVMGVMRLYAADEDGYHPVHRKYCWR
jgi:hypothetical protein